HQLACDLGRTGHRELWPLFPKTVAVANFFPPKHRPSFLARRGAKSESSKCAGSETPHVAVNSGGHLACKHLNQGSSNEIRSTAALRLYRTAKRQSLRSLFSLQCCSRRCFRLNPDIRLKN